MRPTPNQVERSLQALRRPLPGRRGKPPVGAAAGAGDAPVSRAAGDLPAELLAALWTEPFVRAERLAEAKVRLAGGPSPSPEALADRIVGRLVCDRLR